MVTRLTRWARSTDASCRVWPWVNSRSSWPSVAGAYTPPNSRPIPPQRITSRSSMQSAPAAIPAMIEVSFPAGFAPAEATRQVLNTDPLARSAPPGRSARPIPSPGPGPRTTPDARHRRPGPPATSHQVVSLPVPSADWLDQDLDTPDSPSTEGTSTSTTRRDLGSPIHGSRLSPSPRGEPAADPTGRHRVRAPPARHPASPLEHFLELLTTAGFPAADAMRIHRAFVGFLYGHLLAELQDTHREPRRNRRPPPPRTRSSSRPGSSRSCGALPATSPTTTAPANSTTVSTSSSPGSPPPTAGHTRAATNLSADSARPYRDHSSPVSELRARYL